MSDWTCEIEVQIDGFNLLIEGRIAEHGYTGPNYIYVDRIDAMDPVEDVDVELSYIPIHWYPILKSAILQEHNEVAINDNGR